MKRTQLYLTQEQLDWLKKTAKQQNTTMAEISRRAIEVCITQPSLVTKGGRANNTLGEFLRKMAQEAKQAKLKGPKDLAANLDKYLY